MVMSAAREPRPAGQWLRDMRDRLARGIAPGHTVALEPGQVIVPTRCATEDEFASFVVSDEPLDIRVVYE